MAHRREVVILNDTRVDRHHGCTRVMSALENLVEYHRFSIKATAPAHVDWRSFPELVGAIDKAHLIVVNGEGTLHHSRPAGRWLLEAGSYARNRGIPAVLLNTLWQDNDQEWLDLLRAFSLVSVRDTLSEAEVRSAGLECRLVPDLSLYGASHVEPVRRSGFGFTDSALHAATINLERARKQVNGSVIGIQFSEPGYAGTWRFLRSYVGRKQLRHPFELSRLLRLRLQQFSTQTSSADDFIKRLRGLELLVSGRFHACTLAMVARTPFVTAETNSHKIRALIKDVGLAAWRADHSLDPKALEQARRVGWESGELSVVDDYVADARRSADVLFRELADLV